MRTSPLAEKLRSGAAAFGLVHMYPAAGIVEGMCKGWDFVWIDGQHGQMSYDSVLHSMRAAGGIGVETVVRVPSHEPGVLGLFADLAPTAIMVPMVNTRNQAEAIVRALRFAPAGERSYGGRRIIDFDGRNTHVERPLMILAQIETLEGCRNVRDIAAVEGVDGLFFGPDDLKCQLRLPIDTPLVENERLLEELRSVGRAAADAGKLVGTVATSPAALKACLEAGYRLLVAGGDSGFIRQGAAAARDVTRGVWAAFHNAG